MLYKLTHPYALGCLSGTAWHWSGTPVLQPSATSAVCSSVHTGCNINRIELVPTYGIYSCAVSALRAVNGPGFLVSLGHWIGLVVALLGAWVDLSQLAQCPAGTTCNDDAYAAGSWFPPWHGCVWGEAKQ